MATEFSRSMSKFTNDLIKDIERKLAPKIAEMSAQFAVELITKRTQGRGLGLAVDGGSTYPLKRLSTKYISYRRANITILSPATSATTSNLTLTGQMLAAMREMKTENLSIYKITIDGTRSDGKSNAKIARYVSRARPFFFISGGEREQIRNMIRKVLPALAKSNLKR